MTEDMSYKASCKREVNVIERRKGISLQRRSRTWTVFGQLGIPFQVIRIGGMSNFGKENSCSESVEVVDVSKL